MHRVFTTHASRRHTPDRVAPLIVRARGESSLTPRKRLLLLLLLLGVKGVDEAWAKVVVVILGERTDRNDKARMRSVREAVVAVFLAAAAVVSPCCCCCCCHCRCRDRRLVLVATLLVRRVAAMTRGSKATPAVDSTRQGLMLHLFSVTLSAGRPTADRTEPPYRNPVLFNVPGRVPPVVLLLCVTQNQAGRPSHRTSRRCIIRIRGTTAAVVEAVYRDRLPKRA